MLLWRVERVSVTGSKSMRWKVELRLTTSEEFSLATTTNGPSISPPTAAPAKSHSNDGAAAMATTVGFSSLTPQGLA